VQVREEIIMGAFAYSPFIVPIAVFAWLAIAGVAHVIGSVQKRRIQSEERMAMVQRGMSADEINLLLKPADKDIADELAKTRDPLRSLANARRAGVVLVSIGIGIVLFGSLLAFILQDREVLAVSACGLIPLAIGIGFFVDYSLQKRELARFGLEVAADPPPSNPPN
jgi:Flp pilus assembly protein TadB